MKIWVMTNEYDGSIVGGLGIVAINLAGGLAKLNNIEITVICRGVSDRVTTEYKPSLTVIRFPQKSMYHSGQNFNVIPVVNWLQAHGYVKPDLIHIHSLQGYELARYYKETLQVPVIYTCHSLTLLEKQQSGWWKASVRQKSLIRMADAIVVPSIWQKKQIHRYYPFYKKAIKVIRNGVHIRNNPDRKRGDPHRLLYVGRLNHVKGIDELLGAIAILKNQKKSVKLHIIGGGLAIYKNKLRKIVKQLNIENHVTWLGKKTHAEVQKLYASYGCVIVPSRHESFGLTALEAMASGVPLIATRNGGLISFVNSSNATVIPQVRAAKIAACIRRVWNNPQLIMKKVENAKKTARQFNWMHISKKYYEFFRKYA